MKGPSDDDFYRFRFALAVIILAGLCVGILLGYFNP